MAPPNLTRTDAERRGRLLAVDDYAIELDLTDGGRKAGDATFATTSTVRFRCAEPGAGQLGSTWSPPRWHSRALQRRAARRSRLPREDGIALPALAAENELRVEATAGT
jgi:aminopeptidase N